MPSELFGLLGAAALAVAGVPAAPAGTMLLIQLCHGGTIPLNVPTGDDHQPGKNCPGGCHAGCLWRKAQGDSEPDEES